MKNSRKAWIVVLVLALFVLLAWGSWDSNLFLSSVIDYDAENEETIQYISPEDLKNSVEAVDQKFEITDDGQIINLN